MRDRTIQWATASGFSLFAQPGYESPTVTCVRNDPGYNIAELNQYLRNKGMIISNGYGKQLKEKTFRIAHMGDLQMADMQSLFSVLDVYLNDVVGQG